MKKINFLAFVSASLLLIYICIFAYSFVLEGKNGGKLKTSFGIDAAIFYSAGRLTVEQPPASPFNIDSLRTKVEAVVDKKIPAPMTWAYPPSFLLLLAPLATLPYHLFLFIWLAVPATLGFSAIYKLASDSRQAALLACGYPGVLMNLIWGQNGYLTTAFLGFGLYFIEVRPVLAGCMFGLLAYKPNMAFFPFLLLLLAKKWRVLLWAALFATAVSVISVFLFGFALWEQFFNAFLYSSSTLLLGSAWEATSATQTSLYSSLRLAGWSLPFVYAATGLVNVAVTIISLWVWRKTDSTALKSAVIVVGMFIVMPYSRLYDLAILALPFSLLSFDCWSRGHHPFELAILALLWALPVISPALVYATGIQLCPYILLLVLAMIVARAKHPHKQ